MYEDNNATSNDTYVYDEAVEEPLELRPADEIPQDPTVNKEVTGTKRGRSSFEEEVSAFV